MNKSTDGSTVERLQMWRKRIEEQRQSGQSVLAFCTGHGIGHHIFYYWRRKLQAQVVVPGSKRFMMLAGTRAAMTRPARVILPNGVAIELGEGLESGLVNQFLRSLCGVGDAKS